MISAWINQPTQPPNPTDRSTHNHNHPPPTHTHTHTHTRRRGASWTTTAPPWATAPPRSASTTGRRWTRPSRPPSAPTSSPPSLRAAWSAGPPSATSSPAGAPWVRGLGGGGGGIRIGRV